jgi:hypothetical protein
VTTLPAPMIEYADRDTRQDERAAAHPGICTAPSSILRIVELELGVEVMEQVRRKLEADTPALIHCPVRSSFASCRHVKHKGDSCDQGYGADDTAQDPDAEKGGATFGAK